MKSILENIDEEKLELKRLREEYNNAFKPGVSIVVPTFKSKYISNIFKNYSRLYYPVKELIIILNSNELDISEYRNWADRSENVRVFQLDQKCSLGKCLNFGVDESKYDYIAKMDDDDYYGPCYLTDLMNVFNYTDADVTGKNPVFIYFENMSSLYLFKSSKPVNGATLLFKKAVFQRVRFRNLNLKEDYYFLSDCKRAGIKIYPSDKYNYVYIRHSNLRYHTFRVSSNAFIYAYNARKILTCKDFSPFVTV